MYFIVHSAGTRAPGSGNIPTNPTNPEDDDDKGGLSAGVIVGIVLWSLAAVIVLAFIAFVKCNREKTVAALAPAPAVEYNALPPTTHPPECAYRPEPGFPVHNASVNIPSPPSYDQTMSSFPTASAPP